MRNQRPVNKKEHQMYSAKILGNTGSEIKNQSTAKAQFEDAVKSKKSFSQKPAKK
jgi:hypothetical protein